MNSTIKIFALCRQFFQRIGAGMAALAGWGFIACSFFITFDVLARKFFGFSSNATTDLTGYILAFGIAWALAHTLSLRSHVRIDVLINMLPARFRFWLHLLSLTALVVLAGYLSKSAYDLAAESHLFGATDISALRMPLVIPQGIWAFGIGFFFLLSVFMLIENLLLVIAGRGSEAESNLSTRTYRDEAKEVLEAIGSTDSKLKVSP
jgi:TRAP-type C4-dicarboxylate transport system permease small subunit